MKNRSIKRTIVLFLCAILLMTIPYFLKENKSEDNNTKEQKKDISAKENSFTNNSKSSQTPNDNHKSSITTKIEENIPASSETKESLRGLPAGTILNINEVKEMETYFYAEEISDDIFNRIKGISYGDDCTVPLEDLRYVRVLHHGFDNKTHIGELIVNKAIAEDIIDIFKELYEIKYPIEKMVLVDEYNGDDNASMADNNTSSFNYRTVPSGGNLSKHALGLAIDINPLYNPYVQLTGKEPIILPVEGTPYADRSLDNPYYIRENDVLFQAFTKRGFYWGGFWKTEPDYQHFVKNID